jgi:hypothetical protein
MLPVNFEKDFRDSRRNALVAVNEGAGLRQVVSVRSRTGSEVCIFVVGAILGSG